MDDGSEARAAAAASTNGLDRGDTTPTPDPEAAVTPSTSGVGGGDSTEATDPATAATNGGETTLTPDLEAVVIPSTSGVGGGDSTEATDPEAAATNGGGGEAPEADQDLQRLHTYAAGYSGRTRVARLISISQWCAVEKTQLEALRMALDEVINGGDTTRYRDMCNLISGRTTHVYDPFWVETVDESFTQTLQGLQAQFNEEGESMDMIKGYTDMGELYYSHGLLPDAFKCYVKTAQYITSAEQLVRMCLKAVLINLELCKFDLVLQYIGTAEGCQAPLDAVTAAKLHAAAGLAHLGKSEYELAALKFVETGPELGGNYSEVILPADVAIYGALCALASFDSAHMKSKVMENAKFGYFLHLVPQVSQLVHCFFHGEHDSCKTILEAIKPNILPDIHLSEHVETLYFIIIQKSGYISVSGLAGLLTSSPILTEGGPPLNEEGEEQPRVEETQPQNVRVSGCFVLPREFNDESSLVDSAHYTFLNAKELLVSIGKRSISWVSRRNAHAVLINAHLFCDESVDDEDGRFDGRIAVVAESKFRTDVVRYNSYTTTRKILKETRILEKEVSAVDYFQMKGNIWTRRRICLKNDPRYHLLQWRKTAELRRAQVQPPEAASQNENTQLNETMKSLIDQLKDNTNAVNQNTEALTQTRQTMLELTSSLADARTTTATAGTGGVVP